VEVGRIGRPHGVTGEVYVDLTTDRTERVAVGVELVAGDRRLTVVRSQPHQRRFLVRFEGIDSRDAAEALTNTVLRAAPIVDPDALWVDDLIDSVVVDVEGVERGRCTAVVANPAHDLLELDTAALVPVTFVVSCVDGITTIDPPAGLFDLG
jgi:16S rRNA processing protein RimM